jgi:hypothetical protein
MTEQYVLVPAKPTESMLEAGARAAIIDLGMDPDDSGPGDGTKWEGEVETVKATYAAMLSASPALGGEVREKVRAAIERGMVDGQGSADTVDLIEAAILSLLYGESGR